jgi:hypothetical protein
MTRRVLFALSLFLATESLHADSAVLALAQASYTFHEEAGTGAVTILRSGDKTVACSVSYRVSVNTVLIVDTVSFAANEVSKTVSFPIPNDNLYDNYEASSTIYSFSISNAVNAQIGSPGNATIRIIDDEPLPTVTLQCNPTVAEGNSGITLFPVVVTLSGPFRGNVFVDVYVIGGTATADPDFADGFQNLITSLRSRRDRRLAPLSSRSRATTPRSPMRRWSSARGSRVSRCSRPRPPCSRSSTTTTSSHQDRNR